jgi:hypothetical protein
MEVTAGQVLQSFYKLRAAAGGAREPQYYRKHAWSAAEAFLVWAAAESVDPISYLRFRFEAASTRGYTPGLKRLRSGSMAKLWRSEWQRGERALDEGYQKLKARAGTLEEQAVKELLVLTDGMESAKQPYVRTGDLELCVVESEFTGGFHPASRYCPTCPHAVQCAAALHREYGYDVVALRAGRLHELPQKIAAAAAR